MLTGDDRQPLRLGPLVGRGGEGEVFRVDGVAGEVVKRYAQPMTSERIAKIATMAKLASPEITAVCAWPTGLVRETGKPVGLRMAYLAGRKEIHTLHGPKSRKAEFPDASFAFLVHVAANTARAVATLHHAGIVIGDINDRGFLVDGSGMVGVIDCDSFQVRAAGKLFTCDVGMPNYTAPELQGRPLRGVERTPQHDLFALAVLIFQLLLMGRHPFSGQYMGGEIELSEAIREHRYAYSADLARTAMRPPAQMLPVAAITGTGIAQLFERAFAPLEGAAGNLAARPSAPEWVEALGRLGQSLASCNVNLLHQHIKGGTECPWCVLEGRSNVELFHYRPPAGDTYQPLDADQLAVAVGQFKPPVVPATLEACAALPLPPPRVTDHALRRSVIADMQSEIRRANGVRSFAQQAVDHFRRRLRKITAAAETGSLDVRSLQAAIVDAERSARSLLVKALAFIGLRQPGRRREAELADMRAALRVAIDRQTAETSLAAEEAARVRKDLAEAEQQIENCDRIIAPMKDRVVAIALEIEAVVRREREAAIRDIAAAEAELTGHRARYSLLVGRSNQLQAFHLQVMREMKSMLQQLLETDRRRKADLEQIRLTQAQRQRSAFLDSHTIAKADIKGITPSLKATLLSTGIETAADITAEAVGAVKGFGPVRTGALVDWRKSVEKGFKPDRSRIDDPAARAKVEQRYANDRRPIERQLRPLLPRMERERDLLTTEVASLVAGARAPLEKLLQARADRRALEP